MNLAELEKIIDVKFPKKFHEIYETGAMEWVEVGYEKFNENREHYLNDPKAFLMLSCDCEPAFFEDIPDLITTIDEMLTWRKEYINQGLDEKYRLIPFAMNGGGDLYCFLYENNVNEPAVVLYFHDCYDNPEIIGKNFDEFLYIAMLSVIAYAVDDDDFSELEGEQWKNNVNYLLPEYRNIISENNAERLADIYWSLDFDESEI
ncbi:MAG: SMI1/KNR4 family protein, partial [Ruminococcus sp.]|nr:SMI1/KNR4 family protein [Ruminococcus sp.]